VGALGHEPGHLCLESGCPMTAVDSMVSAQHLSAIEKLGKRLEGTFTAEEALTAGGLAGWNVRHVPMFAALPDGEQVEVTDRVAVVRNRPGRLIDYLGITSPTYKIVQNEEQVAFLNDIVDESGASFELALAMNGGRRVAVSMKLPGHILIGGVDPVDISLLTINSHDGTTPFSVLVAPVRYACGNVLNLRFGAEAMFKVRHSSKLSAARLSDAREALDITFNYLDGFQADAEKLIQTSMTQSEFEAIIERNFGADEDASAATKTRAKVRLDDMAELFSDAATQEHIRGTAWAGLNALTEWADHYAPVRGDDHESSRAQRALLDPSFKNKALAAMMAVV
jgi:phage/plasmid-like protein (TIGR03299 family)